MHCESTNIHHTAALKKSR